MIKNVEEIYDLAGSDQFLKLYRINYNGLRLYVRNNPFQYFSGLTGALGCATFSGDPSNKRLKSWREGFIDSFGKTNADNYVQMTADFGSLLHEALVKIKEKGFIDWNEEKEYAENYFRELFLEAGNVDAGLIKQTAYEYQKQVGSLMQFIYDRVNEIYAIEVPVIWDELRIATPIDLACNCRQTPKGDFKNTVINIKTSNQITDHHIEQVSCELAMWSDTYALPVEYAGILRTKDWREEKEPTYDYKYIDAVEAGVRSGSAYQRLKLCLNSSSSYFPEPKTKRFEGISKLGEKPNVVIKNLSEDWGEYWTENIEITA